MQKIIWNFTRHSLIIEKTENWKQRDSLIVVGSC